MEVTSPTFTTNSGTTRQFLHNEQGFEAYYNFAITPWAQLTADVQVVDGAQNATRNGQSISTATVLGLRLGLVF